MPRASDHARFIRRTFELAERGIGRVAPNPLVGACIVIDGKIVGEGHHAKFGGPHAEAAAIADALKNLEGNSKALSRATIYVSLEPCNHYGKQPPCTDAIVGAGIGHVVYAVDDENPLTARQAKAALESKGVNVESGFLARQAHRLNEVFFYNHRHGKPFVVVKAAVTLDGRIAAASGDSKWISSRVSRARVHLMRQRYDAVLVGIGTVLADDPQLTVREDALAALKRPAGFTVRQPAVVVIDRALDIPLDCELIRENSALKRRLFIVCGPRASTRKRRRLEDVIGIQIVESRLGRSGRFDLRAVLDALWGMGVTSVLVEGGSGIYTSVLEQRVAQKLVLFVAPRIVGGDGRSLAGPLGVRRMVDCYNLKDMSVGRSGSDFVVEGYF
jgi:diaminohydroxyphosphoribosylaminopyrimidine deaminase/5-amino-6-(5-phosphoribosylamino)uracil reductase